MPGIAGIITKRPGQEEPSKLSSMLGSMQNEAFYNSGNYRDTALGLEVGWVTQRGSFSDCLPIWNERKDVCLFLAGEIFSDPDEIRALKSNGHTVPAENASYLVHLYEEIGSDFVQHLNGWFSGVLFDSSRERIFLFNDRFGMERIYVHEDESAFYFASEAKALLKVLPRTRELDPRGVGELLACGCVLQDRTLFSGISVMPGGSVWTFPGTEPVRRERYFRREAWEEQPKLSPQRFYQALKDTWGRIVPRYAREGERVALSLTGGVDSRMILAWINPQPGALPCYTWSSKYRECFDVLLARRLATICGQSHEAISLDDTFLGDFPDLAEEAVFVSDGTAGAVGAIDLYLQRKARRIATVRLTGGFGNESLRRKVSFKPGRLSARLFAPEMVKHGETATATYGQELHGNRASFCIFKQAPWHAFATFALERSQLVLRTPYLDNELVALSYRAPTECLNVFLFLRLISDGNPALAEMWTDRGFSLRPSLGTKHLRRWLQEFTFKAEYAYDGGMPQWLTKVDHVFAPLHPERLFLGRHKVAHFRKWYRDELAPYIKEVLLDDAALNRPYVEAKGLRQIVQDHIAGKGNFTQDLDRILSIELVQKCLLKQ